MKIFSKTLLVLIIFIFGIVTPVLATEEKQKLNLNNITNLESITNFFDNSEKNAKSALDKLTEDINKRNNKKSSNEEIVSEEENTTNKAITNLLDRIKAKSESLKGGGLLSILKERLSSIKLDIKIFDKLKNKKEEHETNKTEQNVEETSTNQDLTKGTDKLINSLKNKDNIKLFDENLIDRIDLFFNSFINESI